MTMPRWARRSLGAAVAVACFAVWLGHIGYFGGDTYFSIPAANAGGRQSPTASSIAAPRTVAVLFSGDMGFRVGMGPKIAARLAADGVPVLGVSSLVEFRREHTPAEVRAFVVRSIRRGLTRARADRVILIGQSFGADMLQVGVTELPADLRAKVQMVALVVPGDTLIFRASPAELFNWAKPDAAALPTARALTWTRVICVYGRDEDDSLCPALGMANVALVALPGGHALRYDADALYAVLRRKIAATSTRPADITKSSESGQLSESVEAKGRTQVRQEHRS
jgi:type IV secretory pathway VirJ component